MFGTGDYSVMWSMQRPTKGVVTSKKKRSVSFHPATEVKLFCKDHPPGVVAATASYCALAR